MNNVEGCYRSRRNTHSAADITTIKCAPHTKWGRAGKGDVSKFTTSVCMLIMLLCPVFVLLLHAAIDKFDSSLYNLFLFLCTGAGSKSNPTSTRTSTSAGNDIEFDINAQNFPNAAFPERVAWILPHFSSRSFAVVLIWTLFQAVLYIGLPGRLSAGQRTPAGHLLYYRTNGLNAWLLTHAVYSILVYMGSDAATWIPRNFGSILLSLNILGYATTILAYAKAHYWPTHADDCKFSGSRVYDFFMGIEFNPRIAALNFDFKLFHNGRPGIIAWTLISASCVVLQLREQGYVAPGMQVAALLHFIYVVDFFVHEDWYLRTIDIAHDHFGFYLAWGDYVWLPATYTLQTRYLAARRDATGAAWRVHEIAALALGVVGYFVFRTTNNQKDRVRKLGGACAVWGRPARVLRVRYATADGKSYESVLLACGFWGLARHMNYFGDLCLALGTCLACGFEHVLPYFYFFYMCVLLVTRIRRDDSRCRKKYGAGWEEYCRMVPYKLVPRVW